MQKLISVVTIAAIALLATSAGAIDSFFDVFTELSVFTGPPYPACCHQVAVAHEVGGAVEVDGQLSLGLKEATDVATGDAIPTDLTAGEIGPPGSDFVVDSFFDITYRSDLGGPTFAVDSFFDITVDLTNSDGTPATLVPLHPEIPEGDPARYFDTFVVDSFFDITYRIDFGGGNQHELTFHGAVQPGLVILDASPSLPSPGARPTDSFFDIIIFVHEDEELAIEIEIVELSLTGVWLGGASPVESTTWGTVKTLYR